MFVQIDRRRRGIRALTDGDLVAKAAALVGMSAWSCDLDEDAQAWTDGVFEMFGLPENTQFERPDVVQLYCEESRETLERLRSRAILDRGTFTLEAQIRQPGGDMRWIRIAAATEASNGRTVRLYGMKQDITGERLRWENLRRMAESDSLTGLGNRARFQAEFLDIPTGSDQLAAIGALVMFDLNGFKRINDTWGHAAGDACLAAFGQRLNGAFPQAHLISRIGGDEFAMLLPAGLPGHAVEATLRRNLSRLVEPVEWRGTSLPVGASVGVALVDPRQSPEEIFMAADMALYAAKRSGRNALRISA